MTGQVPGVVSCGMPEISRFLGIVVRMHYEEHGYPHFHAAYGGHKISVEVESAIVRGTFPTRALRHVLEWAQLHRAALLVNWQLARQGEPLERLAPLE